MNQRSRAQSRAKRGMSAAVEDGVKPETSEPASDSGKTRTREAGRSNESWFCRLAPDGAAGAGRESGEAGAQQCFLPPQLQQAWAGGPAQVGVAAAGNCAQMSSRLNNMAVNGFTVLIELRFTPAPTPACGHFLTGVSASRIFFRYLAGSLSKSFLQPEQHSLTSWPW